MGFSGLALDLKASHHFPAVGVPVLSLLPVSVDGWFVLFLFCEVISNDTGLALAWLATISSMVLLLSG